MIYQISKSHCLELLSSVHCDDATLDLFLMLLDICPLPKLTEIKVKSTDAYLHLLLVVSTYVIILLISLH